MKCRPYYFTFTNTEIIDVNMYNDLESKNTFELLTNREKTIVSTHEEIRAIFFVHCNSSFRTVTCETGGDDVKKVLSEISPNRVKY